MSTQIEKIGPSGKVTYVAEGDDYTPGTPGSQYDKHGDPGDAPEWPCFGAMIIYRKDDPLKVDVYEDLNDEFVTDLVDALYELAKEEEGPLTIESSGWIGD